jgi:predicted DNA-binding transcriptional regulator AlpA
MDDNSIDKLLSESVQKALLSEPFTEQLNGMLEKAIAKIGNKSNNPKLPEYLTPEQVEKMFDICPVTRLRWQKAGSLPAPAKIGGRLYYLKSEVIDKVMQQRKVI